MFSVAVVVIIVVVFLLGNVCSVHEIKLLWSRITFEQITLF